MNIEQACEAFKKLLEEQQQRIANMDCTKTDFTTKKVVTIGVVDALPIFGAGTILWPWMVLALFRGQWIWAAGLAAIYGMCNLTRQWLEARYMGERMGISALENLLAMYVGLELFGVLGLFLGPMGYLLVKETVKKEEEEGKNKDKY